MKFQMSAMMVFPMTLALSSTQPPPQEPEIKETPKAEMTATPSEELTPPKLPKVPKAKESKVEAKKPAEKNSLTPLKDAIASLQSEKGLEIPVTRILKLALLEKEKKQEGKMYLSQGRMRLELGEPEAFKLLIDKKQIWIIQDKPKELGGGTQVSRVRNKGIKKNNAILALFINQSVNWNNFKLLSRKESGDQVEYTFEPKPKAELPEVKKLYMAVQTDEKRLKTLSYWDELENESNYSFGSPKKKNKFDSSFFTYKPTANESISEY